MSTSSKLGFLTPRVRLGVVRTIENDFPPLSSVRTRFGQVSSPPPPLSTPPPHTHAPAHSLSVWVCACLCACACMVSFVYARVAASVGVRESCACLCARGSLLSRLGWVVCVMRWAFCWQLDILPRRRVDSHEPALRRHLKPLHAPSRVRVRVRR
jgi:hypothetical protein